MTATTTTEIPEAKWVNTRQTPFNGTVVFWTLTDEVPHEYLKAEFTKIGLSKMAPNPMTPYARLRVAMDYTMLSPSELVRSLPDQAGWCLVKEQPNVNGNVYDASVVVVLDDKHPDGIRTTKLDPSRKDDYANVVTKFREMEGMIHHSHISHALIRCVEKFDGESLRAHGGVYWIPAQHDAMLDELARIVREGEKQRANVVYRVRHTFDADSVVAVTDAINRGLLASIAKLHEEAAQGDDDADEDSAAQRSRAIAGIRAKIEAMEKASGLTLDAAREGLRKLNVAEATAVLIG